jgi:hypothetical protein
MSKSASMVIKVGLSLVKKANRGAREKELA